MIIYNRYPQSISSFSALDHPFDYKECDFIAGMDFVLCNDATLNRDNERLDFHVVVVFLLVFNMLF